MGTQVFAEISPALFVSAQVAGHGTSPTTLAPEHTPNYRLDQVLVKNEDTVPLTIQLYFYQAGTYFPIGQAVVAAGAGNGTVAPVDILALILPATFSGLVVPANFGVSWALVANLTAGPCYVNGYGGYL
jgi:hypothetical protein